MAKFEVKQITSFDDLKINDSIGESDFSHYHEGKFYQFKYIKDEEQIQEFTVKPGIWSIQVVNGSYSLIRTEFTSDNVLDSFVYTKEIEDKVNMFFNKLHVYKELGIDVPRRAALLWGPAGSGKSTGLRKVAQNYVKDGKTAIIMWSTDAFEPYDVKSFVKSFVFEGVEKIIFIMEDLGGTEVQNVDVPSDPSLLALLDNSEKIFKIPVYVLTTTNFPAIFASNLANRPGRFDDKIKVPYPSSELRTILLEFFLKNQSIKPNQEILDLIGSNSCKEFTPAHIKEVVIRSLLHDKTIENSIREIINEIEVFNKGFDDKGRFGFT